MMVDDVLSAILKLGILLFLTPMVLGFLWGLVRRDAGQKISKWPGLGYYICIEIAVLIDKGFPFLWGNLAHMIPMTPPYTWVCILIGIVGGAITLLEAGNFSQKGYLLAARIFGFQSELTIKPKKKKAKPVTNNQAATEKTSVPAKSKSKKRKKR